MSKILIELNVELGEDKNEEMNSLVAELAIFLGPRVKGFKSMTARIADGQDEPKTSS